MQTVTVQITNSKAITALKFLEENQLLKIVGAIGSDSPVAAGHPLGLEEFKGWIKDAEDAPLLDIKEAKLKWANKKKEFLHLIK